MLEGTRALEAVQIPEFGDAFLVTGDVRPAVGLPQQSPQADGKAMDIRRQGPLKSISPNIPGFAVLAATWSLVTLLGGAVIL